jgi:ribosomal protein S18 acetylase RimI-like enzyme
MNIRRATTSDVPALVALNRTVQSMHADALPEIYRRDAPDAVVERAFTALIEAPSSYWLLAEQKEPIGFLSSEFRDQEESWCKMVRRVCYLAGIVVVPRFQQKGVARALVAELKREVEHRGVQCVELDVWAFNGTAAQAFARLGFRPLVQRMTMALGGAQEAEPTSRTVADRANTGP